MWSTLTSGETVNIFIAYLAGFGTFFASCLIPLVPTYLALLTGTVHSGTKSPGHAKNTMRQALWFVSGFTGSFVTLSFILQRLALTLGPVRPFLQHISGGVFIVAGILMLSVVPLPWLQREWRFQSLLTLPEFLQPYANRLKWLSAFLFGVFFGFGWTPCIGPVLAVILFWSAQQASVWSGLALLVAFGLGLGTPFLLVALAFDRVFPLLRKWQKTLHTLQAVAAVIVILTGILLLTGYSILWHQVLGPWRFTF